MTLKQSSKQGTIKLTKPVSPTSAGEIRSTSEDTSGWGTDASSNVIDSGRLALSTSSSTTITACQTLYPELWANAPTSWRSGSNLEVPPQGGNMVGEWVSYTPSPTGFTASAINGFYRVVGDSIEIKVRAVISSVSGIMGVSIPSGFTEDSSKYPSSATNSFYGSASAVDTNLNAMWTGNPYIASAGVISFYGPDGSSSVWDAADPFAWASNDLLTFEITIPVTELAETNTPYIQAYNNIAAGALGLPEATATQAGTVSYYNRVDLVLDNEFTGGTRDITVERIGNTVTITGHGTASHAANATPETSAGFIPSWARPRVTTENVYALEPGRVNAVYVEADGTLSCNYKTWTGADSNAGNVGANRTINIQYNVE